MFTRLLPDWTKDTLFQIKGIAIKEAHNAFWKTCKAYKGSGKPTIFPFHSRKDPVQSCFIPKTAISNKGTFHKYLAKVWFMPNRYQRLIVTLGLFLKKFGIVTTGLPH